MSKYLVLRTSTVLALLACTGSESPIAEPSAEPMVDKAPAEAAPADNPSQVFFGDTHLHTSFSFDAGLFGCTLTPVDAYRFAKGESVTATHGVDAKIPIPLDFLVVADHAENLGFFQKLAAGDEAVLANEMGKRWYDLMQEGKNNEATLDLINNYAAGRFPEELMMKGEAIRPLWNEMITAAEAANDPGKFTAFIGYEWTSMPKAENLHRVVIFEDGAERAKQITPFSALDSDDPERLWDALEAYEAKTGGRVLAIAHNGNVSNGRMFALKTESGADLDRAYAERRMRWEPLYEITQIKGDGEAHPMLSPDDEFADFGTWDQGNLDLTVAKKPEQLQYEYGRSALKLGLQVEADLGANPFKFGVIGSTDSHTGLATADSSAFFGKTSHHEPSAERPSITFIDDKAGKIMAWETLASGYAAVWAQENTRTSLFEAMKRKETYATTGPRMTVRFFGGWDLAAADLEGDYVSAGYGRGVPMGGDLAAKAGDAPTFLVAATMEADGSNLDRVQVVKGWLDAEGKPQEKVYDVAWSDERVAGDDGKLPAVGNTVDLKTCSTANSIGAPELKTAWTDPDFDAAQRAFYYVRVLEIPTARFPCYDVRDHGATAGPEVLMVNQQRAYTSSIWYTPAG